MIPWPNRNHGGLGDSGAEEQGEPAWVGETQSRLEAWVSQSSDQASAGVTQSESANEANVFNHRSVSSYPSMDLAFSSMFACS